MSLALSIGGLLLFTGVFVWLAWTLLYFEKLDREAKLGCGCFLAWFLFLLGGQVYYIALRLPELWEIRKLGLTLQEIHTAEQLADTRVHFLEGRQLLARMDGALDDPTDPVWAEAQQYIQQRLGAPTRFNRSVWGAFLEWGRTLAREQAPSRQAVSDRLAMRAGLARLVALDDLPDKVSQFKPRWGKWSNRERLPADSIREGYADQLLIQMHLFYPNDDVAYLAMSVGLRPPTEKYTTAGSVLRLLFLSEIVVLAGLLIQRCVRLVTLTFLGRALLLYRSPDFLTFEREAVSPTRFVVSFAVIGVITAPIA